MAIGARTARKTMTRDQRYRQNSLARPSKGIGANLDSERFATVNMDRSLREFDRHTTSDACPSVWIDHGTN